MALGDGEAQEEAAAADGGDRLAGQHHGAARDRHGQHAAVARGHNRTLGLLLHHDLALGLARSKLVAGDVDGGTKLVEPLRRRHPTLDQGFAARQFGLCRRQLGLERAHLGVEGGDLKGDLVVTHRGEVLALRHAVSFADGEVSDDAADARPRRHGVPGFDAAIHRLPLGDRGRRERQRPGRGRDAGQ